MLLSAVSVEFRAIYSKGKSWEKKLSKFNILGERIDLVYVILKCMYTTICVNYNTTVSDLSHFLKCSSS